MIKKILALILFIGLTYPVNAQLETPQPSPASKLEQKVGLTDITIEYSRPGVKGRIIFGDLVPYGELWRTGANANTKITFSNDASFGDHTLKAGTYAIFTKPTKETWEIYFYTDSNNWGTPKKWDENKVALKVIAKPQEISFNVESFTIDVNGLSNNGGSLEFMWEKTYISVPFTVPTDKLVVENIEKVMAGPSVNDYFNAAKYYFDAGKDINKAKQWIETAVALRKEPAYWYLRLQSQIYAKLGDKKEAIDIAKKSLDLAKKAGNTGYVKMNQESIAKWSQ